MSGETALGVVPASAEGGAVCCVVFWVPKSISAAMENDNVFSWAVTRPSPGETTVDSSFSCPALFRLA